MSVSKACMYSVLVSCVAVTV